MLPLAQYQISLKRIAQTFLSRVPNGSSLILAFTPKEKGHSAAQLILFQSFSKACLLNFTVPVQSVTSSDSLWPTFDFFPTDDYRHLHSFYNGAMPSTYRIALGFKYYISWNKNRSLVPKCWNKNCWVSTSADVALKYFISTTTKFKLVTKINESWALSDLEAIETSS